MVMCAKTWKMKFEKFLNYQSDYDKRMNQSIGAFTDYAN